MRAYVIGLTGQTGAGKTTVCDVLRRKGFSVINCDLVSREVVEKGKPALLELTAHFGGDILNGDGNLNRKKLAGLVFGKGAEEARAAMSSILYPHITKAVELRMNAIDAGNTNGIVLDAPTLLESGIDSICDVVASVIAPQELRKARVMSRDALTEAEADARIASQQTDSFYSDRSRYVLRNDGGAEALERMAEELAEALVRGSRASR